MLSQNTPNQLSRRKWLRDAALATTGAAMLPSMLTGCTDHPLGLGGTQDTWYWLRARYMDTMGVAQVGYLSSISDDPLQPDYAYVEINSYKMSRFKIHPATELGEGWQYWEIEDGYWLSLRRSGWAYRSNYSNRVAWKIVGGKLYNNYWGKDEKDKHPNFWQQYPAGCPWYNDDVFSTWAYYIGVDRGNIFTCELVPAK